MKARKILLAGGVAALTLLAASCHDDDNDDAAGPVTLEQFATGDINSRTTDTALPVEINDLPIDASNEAGGQFAGLLPSS